MALPAVLVMEMRLAFRSCARQHKISSVRYFNNTSMRAKKDSTGSRPAWPYEGALTPRNPSSTTGRSENIGKSAKEQTGLATQDAENRNLDTGRKDTVPMKIIPKAQINSKMTLTPRQRLHIEILTRRAPVEVEKKLFRERLQIYHMGSMRENALAIVKVSSIVCACAVTFVIAPAHLSAGTAPWLTLLIWLAGFVPGIGVQYMTKNWVNRVFLELPDKARESSKAAMEYAQNIPADAMMDIRYLKLWGLEGSVKATTSELVPTKGTFFRPSTFTWSDRLAGRRDSSWWVPDTFFAEPESASGSSSVNTVPGIWGPVYRKITKDSNKESPKWGSRLEPYET